MKFDWCTPKSAKCLRERGFDFGFASQVFLSELCIEEEDLFAEGERRYLATGPIGDRIYVVAYTERGDATWLISAREATSTEIREWRASSS